MERSLLAPSKRETSKASSYGSKSHISSGKGRDSAATLTAMAMSTSLWNKVYWLSVDYLVVAKAAVICGLYFTSAMYVEHWCEEHFKSLTLGSPDFSHAEMLPHHVEILVSAVTHINEPGSLYGIIQSHKEFTLADIVDSLMSVETVEGESIPPVLQGTNGSAKAKAGQQDSRQFLHLLRNLGGLEINRGRTEWRKKPAR